MTDRLKWTRDGEGLVAFPDGLEHPNRFARISLTNAKAWQWLVTYEGASARGLAGDRQSASDAANEAWPSVVAAGEVLQREAEDERQLAERIDEIAAGAEFDAGEIVADATDDRLRRIIWHAKRLWSPDGTPASIKPNPNLERLMGACSDELARRRGLLGG